MKYISTRNNCEPVDAAAAIAQGMVPDGGLFVPAEYSGIGRKGHCRYGWKILSGNRQMDFSSIFE